MPHSTKSPDLENNELGPLSKYQSIAEKGSFGDEARACLRCLVERVFAARGGLPEPITYQELAALIDRKNKHGVGHAHGMGRILGVMGHLLKPLVFDDWGARVPRIQCLVVLKSGAGRGLPDCGIEEFLERYKRWTPAVRRRHVEREYQRIAEFGSRWNQVLGALGVSAVGETAVVPPACGARFFGYGGESPQHRRLQQWISRHPEIVGVANGAVVEENFALPSADELDVLFRTETECVAVEVKSKVSDRLVSDYERGLYQTVKYSALLRAMYTAGDPESRPNVRTVLVLESRLPEEYRKLATDLSAQVIEGVIPEDGVVT